jgi:hypothetical protein
MPQYGVAVLVKGGAINGGLRLVLGHLWASDMCHLFVTPHYCRFRLMKDRTGCPINKSMARLGGNSFMSENVERRYGVGVEGVWLY